MHCGWSPASCHSNRGDCWQITVCEGLLRGGCTNLICTDLQKAHLEEACELFAASYRYQRKRVPVFGENKGSTERILPMLQWCLEYHSGVAVFENNKMIAYMTGFYIDGLLWVHKGILSPEWAHVSSNERAFEVYRLMYLLAAPVYNHGVGDKGRIHTIFSRF